VFESIQKNGRLGIKSQNQGMKKGKDLRKGNPVWHEWGGQKGATKQRKKMEGGEKTGGWDS